MAKRGKAHWKNNHNLSLPLDDNSKVKADLEPLERLMDKHILDLVRRDEPRAGAEQMTRGETRRLDAQPAHHEQGLGRVRSLRDQVAQHRCAE